MSEYTTIRVSKAIRDTLIALKVHPKETYEEVIRRLIEGCLT